MKKFLRAIAAVQSGVIAGLYQKKEPSLLHKIGGAELENESKSDTINFEEYEEIIKNLKGHKSDWQRFQLDENKVVLEKNLLFNVLKTLNVNESPSKCPPFIVLRPGNDTGLTHVNLPDGFLKPLIIQTWFVDIFALIVAAYGLYMGVTKNGGYLLLLLVTIFLLWAIRAWRKASKKDKSEWEEQFTKHPSHLFGNSLCTYPTWSRSCWYLKSVRVVFNFLSYNPFKERYVKMLNALVINASNMHGRIAWFWYYSERFQTLRGKILSEVKSSQLIDTHFFSVKSSPSVIDYKISIGTSRLVSVVETKYSFIFYLDYFTEDMDESENMPEYKKLVESKKSNIFNESLFRNCGLL